MIPCVEDDSCAVADDVSDMLISDDDMSPLQISADNLRIGVRLLLCSGCSLGVVSLMENFQLVTPVTPARYDEGSDWEIIVAAVLTVGAIFFQIWSKYDEWKNPENYDFDWKAEQEEEYKIF